MLLPWHALHAMGLTLKDCLPPAFQELLGCPLTISYWLATGAPAGQELAGRAYSNVPEPEGGYDLVKGEQVYTAQFAICHGANGGGQKSDQDYVFPTLWGADSFNWGAGLHRINIAAAFIKENMPLGKGGTLSDEEAWHVAAFMNSHERPQDPRLVDGSVEKTRVQYHANDGVNLPSTVRHWANECLDYPYANLWVFAT
jgi:thiosulfate dehydrogenase